jgi:hypothetical protein
MPTRSKTASRSQAGEAAAVYRPDGQSFSMPPRLPACIALKGTQAGLRMEEVGRRGRGLPAPAQLSLSLSPLARLAPSPGSQVQQSCAAAQIPSPAGIKSPPTRLALSPGSQVSWSSLIMRCILLLTFCAHDTDIVGLLGCRGRKSPWQ